MSQVLAVENLPHLSEIEHPFLEELIKQIRLADTFNKYCEWSDRLLVNQLIISPNKAKKSYQNIDCESLAKLLSSAFYQAIGSIIEKTTGHSTETFVHLKDQECNSVVVFCGGVLVLYSLIWGHIKLSFSSLQELIESAETNIRNAVIKASLYLDFVC